MWMFPLLHISAPPFPPSSTTTTRGGPMGKHGLGRFHIWNLDFVLLSYVWLLHFLFHFYGFSLLQLEIIKLGLLRKSQPVKRKCNRRATSQPGSRVGIESTRWVPSNRVATLTPFYWLNPLAIIRHHTSKNMESKFWNGIRKVSKFVDPNVQFAKDTQNHDGCQKWKILKYYSKYC